MPEPRGGFNSANGATVYRDEIVLAEKNVELAQFETIVWSDEFSLVEHDEIVTGELLDFWALVCVSAIFDREMMEAKLFSQFFKILAGRIAYVSPNNVAVSSELADIRGSSSRKLPVLFKQTVNLGSNLRLWFGELPVIHNLQREFIIALLGRSA